MNASEAESLLRSWSRRAGRLCDEHAALMRRLDDHPRSLRGELRVIVERLYAPYIIIHIRTGVPVFECNVGGHQSNGSIVLSAPACQSLGDAVDAARQNFDAWVRDAESRIGQLRGILDGIEG